MKHRAPNWLLASILFLLAACTKEQSTTEADDTLPTAAANARAKKSVAYELYKAEYITNGASGHVGRTLYFKDVGNKQLAEDFVPGDPRRGDRSHITYTVDKEYTSDNGLTLARTTAAIDRAMATWNSVNCSNLGLVKVLYSGNLGFVSSLFHFGGSDAIVADVHHAGFLPLRFFEAIFGNEAVYILGVTFTIIWVDEEGVPTDIDGNGLYDVAMREIYYNDGYTWALNDRDGIDIESVALHEAGHGLSQAHFGQGFETGSNGQWHSSPYAVMNAYYLSELRQLQSSDEGGHCSLWADWPNN